MLGRFLLLDPSIEGSAGHHLEYALVVLRAAALAGYEPILATNRRFHCENPEFATYPIYEHGFWAAPPRSGESSLVRAGIAQVRRCAKAVVPMLGRWSRQRSDQVRTTAFTRDTASLLRQLSVRPGDEVFVPTVGQVELDGLLRAFSRIDHWEHARWHLVFRRDPMQHDAPELRRRLTAAFRSAKPAYSSGRLRFYTDTDELSRAYGELADMPMVTLPIPHAGPADTCKKESAGPLRILYLGDARKEKGYHHLPAIVRDVWPDCVAGGQIQFVIQSNPAMVYEEPEVRAARQQLRAMAGDSLTLITDPLPSEQYRKLLTSGDLMLLPYDPQAYRRRSSGILAEALAAAVIPIVPAETWLASQLEAGGLTYHHIDEVPSLIRQAVAQIETRRNAAKSFAVNWARRHSAENLVKILIGPAETPDFVPNH